MPNPKSPLDDSYLAATGRTWVDDEQERLRQETEDKAKKKKRNNILKVIAFVLSLLLFPILIAIVNYEYQKYRNSSDESEPQLIDGGAPSSENVQ